MGAFARAAAISFLTLWVYLALRPGGTEFELYRTCILWLFVTLPVALLALQSNWFREGAPRFPVSCDESLTTEAQLVARAICGPQRRRVAWHRF